LGFLANIRIKPSATSIFEFWQAVFFLANISLFACQNSRGTFGKVGGLLAENEQKANTFA
jgi:hypothetical protein